MTEKELLGKNDENSKNLEKTEEFPEGHFEQKLKELKEGIGSAENLVDLAENLKKADFPNAALGVVEVAEDLKQTIKENKGSESFKHTVENILASEDLFKGENLNLYSDEFNAKLRSKIKELVKKEIGGE